LSNYKYDDDDDDIVNEWRYLSETDHN